MCIATTSSINDENQSMSVSQVSEDKERLKTMVVAAITESLPDLVENERANDEANGKFARIANALEGSNASLKVNTLSGGYSNLSYQIQLEQEEESNSNSILLFAKLCFERALWNPDSPKAYLLDRTVNEFTIMNRILDTVIDTDDIVAEPHLCLDLLHGDIKMKLLVTAWSKSGDEQFANQIIDGIIDKRVAPRLGKFMAQINAMEEFPKDINDDVRDILLGTTEGNLNKMEQALQTNLDDDVVKDKRLCELAQSWGADVCRDIFLLNEKDLKQKECFGHQDLHLFNILVEAKPPVSTLENFGPNGTVAVVDWELAFWGPKGRDMGLLWSWPISALLAHTLNGHADNVYNAMLSLMDQSWDAYAKQMLESHHVDEEDLKRTYRNSMAWAGWFVFFSHYNFGAQIEHFTGYNELSPTDQDTLREAIGIVGLKLLHYCYINEDGQNLDSVSISDMTETRNAIFNDELQVLNGIAASRRRRSQRMSTLRLSNRRLSDAAFHSSFVNASFVKAREDSIRNSAVRYEVISEDSED
mmetsp:Transcript_2780/g.7784  ORF Transcript_2780/g.7784 Transcript_2780/m.7784 type:complete len:531 (+) Transcript_2780:84-1676(+)